MWRPARGRVCLRECAEEDDCVLAESSDDDDGHEPLAALDDHDERDGEGVCKIERQSHNGQRAVWKVLKVTVNFIALRHCWCCGLKQLPSLHRA